MEFEPTVIEKIRVPDDERKTSEYLTDYEITEIISIRATQISKNNDAFVDTDHDNAIDIAKAELLARKCPLILVREVGKNYVEHWLPNEMVFPLL